MTYKESITKEMEALAGMPDTVFIGEGLINAGRCYGTLDNVPTKKCVEMPICENLIVGAAIGMSLKGLRPVVVFQRMDFMLIAADAIINHLALIEPLSDSQFKTPVIIRTIVGSQDKKFDVGPQHNHDFRNVFDSYINVQNYGAGIYKSAYDMTSPIIIVEHKDLYESEGIFTPAPRS